MLDPIIEFFSRTFYLFGRGVGQLVAWALWPFAKLYAFYVSTGFIWKSLIGLGVVARQVAMARAEVFAAKGPITPILVGGSPMSLMRPSVCETGCGTA